MLSEMRQKKIKGKDSRKKKKYFVVKSGLVSPLVVLRFVHSSYLQPCIPDLLLCSATSKMLFVVVE